jgi:branched-chain amino acid transport system ATP-binding protein
MLEVKNITVYYGNVLALNNVSISVLKNEIFALVGPNGAGKSTVLKAISGLIIPRSGEILFQGEKINGLQPYALVKKGLCLVPEGRRIFYSMSVLENLEMGAFTLNKEFINDVLKSPIIKERLGKVDSVSNFVENRGWLFHKFHSPY